MNGENSKTHEITVLKSVFEDSKSFFDGLGYGGYAFECQLGNSIPDGIFYNETSVIWIEHTQARLNYGEKRSLLPGLDGLCNDVQHVLLKEGVTGCVCFDVSSVIANKYFDSSLFRTEFLDITRDVVSNTGKFIDSERNIRIKYCRPNECVLKNLDEYKGLRITVSQLNNIEFCQVIEREVYERCVSIKEGKYKSNLNRRDGNWLFIEQPWGYSFRNDLPSSSEYFDKIFIIEKDFLDNRECYVPSLVATKDYTCNNK